MPAGFSGIERPNNARRGGKNAVEVDMGKRLFGFGMPGIFFAPDGDGGGGGGTTTGNAPGSSTTGTEGGDGGTPPGTPPAGGGDGGGVTFTPEQQRHVDDLVKARLERERTKIKAEQETAQKRAQEEAEQQRLAEQAKWKELSEKQATELEKLKDEKAAYELAALRREVAEAAGLTPELAQRLQGTTREELEADAKKLAELLPPDPRPMVAVEVGLPKELASRVKQGTREEMLADAKELLKHVKPVSPGSPPSRPRVGSSSSDEISEEREKKLRQRYRIR